MARGFDKAWKEVPPSSSNSGEPEASTVFAAAEEKGGEQKAKDRVIQHQLKKKSDEQADSQTLYLKFRYVYKILNIIYHLMYYVISSLSYMIYHDIQYIMYYICYVI